MAVPAAAEDALIEVFVVVVLHTAAVAAAVVGSATVTHFALVSGRQGRCKALCSCLGPSNKPCLRGT